MYIPFLCPEGTEKVNKTLTSRELCLEECYLYTLSRIKTVCRQQSKNTGNSSFSQGARWGSRRAVQDKALDHLAHVLHTAQKKHDPPSHDLHWGCEQLPCELIPRYRGTSLL